MHIHMLSCTQTGCSLDNFWLPEYPASRQSPLFQRHESQRCPISSIATLWLIVYCINYGVDSFIPANIHRFITILHLYDSSLCRLWSSCKRFRSSQHFRLCPCKLFHCLEQGRVYLLHRRTRGAVQSTMWKQWWSRRFSLLWFIRWWYLNEWSIQEHHVSVSWIHCVSVCLSTVV